MMIERQEVKPYQSEDVDKKTQVENMFDTIAPTYDGLNKLLSLRFDRIWRKNVIKRLKNQQPKRVLDVATGTGDLALAMEPLLTEQIIGLDLSQNMLNEAEKKIKKRKLENRIELLKGDSEQLPFADNSFDAITCSFGVRNFGDLQAGLREFSRVISPDGQVIILEFSTPDNKIFKKIYDFYFFNVLPFVGQLLSGEKRAYAYLPESVEAFPSGKDFISELNQAGFSQVIYQPQTFGICSIYQARK